MGLMLKKRTQRWKFFSLARVIDSMLRPSCFAREFMIPGGWKMNFSADVIRGSFIKFSCCFSFTSAILLRSIGRGDKQAISRIWINVFYLYSEKTFRRRISWGVTCGPFYYLGNKGIVWIIVSIWTKWSVLN